MYFAHTGHAHASEVAATSAGSDATIGIIFIAGSALVLGYFAYDTMKSRKPKSKK